MNHDEAAIAALTRIAHGDRVDEDGKAVLRPASRSAAGGSA
ncbi:MAG TPA: hypothetical protein VFX16_10215 [Pseudonocardiaceae bacterium]|nr:hypothetical protein [Pseudonocardiaceae bacterium]